MTPGDLLCRLYRISAPGYGCWRSLCRNNCKAKVRKHKAEIATEALKALNCTTTERDIALFDLLRKRVPAPSPAGAANRTIANRAPRGESARRIRTPACTVGGVPLCNRAVASVLGIGAYRGSRILTGRFDKRRMPRPRERPGRAEIYSFLWHVYAHVAEARPDEPTSLGRDGDGKELHAFLGASAALGEPFGEDF